MFYLHSWKVTVELRLKGKGGKTPHLAACVWRGGLYLKSKQWIFFSEQSVHSSWVGKLLLRTRLQRSREILHSHKPLQPGQTNHHALRVAVDDSTVRRETV